MAVLTYIGVFFRILVLGQRIRRGERRAIFQEVFQL
jgi:hypothetical protein